MCRTFEGDLVTIHDEKKQLFVYNNLAAGKTLWIGLKRDDKYVSKFGIKVARYGLDIFVFVILLQLHQ